MASNSSAVSAVQLMLRSSSSFKTISSPQDGPNKRRNRMMGNFAALLLCIILDSLQTFSHRQASVLVSKFWFVEVEIAYLLLLGRSRRRIPEYGWVMRRLLRMPKCKLHALYKVNFQLVQNVLLTSKQKFRFGLARSKRNLCFEVNGRLCTSWMVTLYFDFGPIRAELYLFCTFGILMLSYLCYVLLTLCICEVKQNNFFTFYVRQNSRVFIACNADKITNGPPVQ